MHVLAHGVLPGGCALVAHDFFGADLTAACAREPTGRRPLGAQVRSTFCAGTGLTPATSAPGLARACLGCADSATRRGAAQRARAQIVYWARRAGGRVLNIGSIRAAAALLEASLTPSLPHHDGRYSHHGVVASTPSWPSATNGDADGACIVAH